MSYAVDELEPKIVWKHFDEIRKIPHGSGNERALGEAVMSWAREHDCDTEMDDLGNVVIRVPATEGHEKAPTVVLQGHLDMVCEKNSDKDFDFEKDAIELIRDGDWITADGTTLGADNGIGVAMSLAMMDMPDAVHGPLELLFTVDEETGLNGATGLKPGFVSGEKLVNLDSEDLGVFYVGCAGGRDAHISLPLQREAAAEGAECLTLRLRGLRGGHSGLDISDNRGNAIELLARAVDAASREASLRLVSIEGGDKHNAIPREASASIQVEAGETDKIESIAEARLAGFREEFGAVAPELDLAVEKSDLPGEVLTATTTRRAIGILLALPSGVLTMSRDIVGLVETSNNMARVRCERDKIEVLTSGRSAVDSAIDGVIARVRAVGELAGAAVEPEEGYPGWQPDMESELLATSKQVWIDVHGEEPKFTAIHAGLETGIIGEKNPGMDMVSIGPQIDNPHSPDERVSIDSVKKTFDFVVGLLDRLARDQP